MLKDIGIYGYSALENGIKAALITGDPLLFVGKHGTAKTALCRNLARRLGLEYHAYDASKAMFEDIIGFPDPRSLKNSSIDYIPTPMSIWGKEFILIDEISRAQPALQNKWLEIIRSHSVMGMHLRKLQYVFAAMNPPSYLGSNTLDEALAGRFAVILHMPDIMDMDRDDMESIIMSLGSDDAAAINRNNTIEKSEMLLAEINSLRSKMVQPEQDNRISALVIKTMHLLSEKDINLDGRRAAMLFRNIKARIIMDGSNHISQNSLCDTLSYSLPYSIKSKDTVINYSRLAADALMDERSLYFYPGSPLKSVSNLKYCSKSQTAELVIMGFLEKFKVIMTTGKSKEIAQYINSYFKILEYVNDNSDKITLNTVELVMGGFMEYFIQAIYRKEELHLNLENNSKNAAAQISMILSDRAEDEDWDLRDELSTIMEEGI